jgi:hypothetical protein
MPSLTCFDDLRISVQYQLDINTIMSRDPFEGGGDVVDAVTVRWATRPMLGLLSVGLQYYNGHVWSRVVW